MVYKINSNDLVSIVEENYYAKQFNFENLFTCDIRKNQFSDDVIVFDTSIKLNKKDLVVESSEDNFEGVCINFNINGKFNFRNNNFDFTGKEDYSTVTYIKGNTGKVFYNGTNFRSIGVFVTNEFLEENLLKHLDIDLSPNILFKNEPTSIVTKTCIRDILNTPFEGQLNSLFMQSKILEILFHEFSYILNAQKLKPKRKRKVLFSEQDMEALKKAREILLHKYINPPTIKELSKIVALNEFKLKVGFKTFFKETPYSMVKNERMRISKSLLKTTDYNINEVSKAVGFKNQSHFSKAFYDFYNVLPKDLMKSRKFYY